MTLIDNALAKFARNLTEKASTVVQKPSDWISQHFYIPDPRDPMTDEAFPPGPIRLADYQKRIIDAALERDEKGNFLYNTVVYSAPKKSGKSAITSAVILYIAYHQPNSFAACLANDGTQSKDRLYLPIFTCINLHKQLGGIFKDVTPYIEEVILPNMTKIRAVPCDAAGEAGSQPVVSAFCFDERTEILTKSGWKYYSDLTEDTIYATVNPNSGIFEWQKANAFYLNKYAGDMYSYNTRLMSACVTPNHKFIGRYWLNQTDPSDEHVFEIGSAVDEVSSGYIQLNQNSWGEFAGTIPSFIDDGYYLFSARTHKKSHRSPLKVKLEDFVELLAWFLSEGCVKYKTRNGKRRPECVMLGVSKNVYPENYERIWNLIKRIGLKPSHWKKNDSICFYDMRITEYLSQFGLSQDKYIPEWVKELPAKYLEIFLHTYYLGDGYLISKERDHGFAIGTISNKMAEDLSEIGLKLRYAVSMNEYEEKRSKYTAKVIRFRGGEEKRYVNTHVKHWKVENYSGYVWCPSTTNGIVFVRRDRGPIHLSKNSELWGYDTERKKRLYTEMTIPVTLYGKAIRWVETYAGYSGQSELLEQLYKTSFLEAEPHPEFNDLMGDDGPVVRINKNAMTFTYWDTVPRQRWQQGDNGEAYYRAEASNLPTNEFQRIHRNKWVSSLNSFVEESWWNACINEKLPPLVDKYTPVVVGIDMAVSRDCAALVAVTRDPFDPEHSIAVRGVRVFSPKAIGGIIDQETLIRPVIEDWAERWNVVCWVYDPHEMAKLAQDMVRAGKGWFKPFGQNQPRAVSDKQLHDMILHRQVSWNPNTTEGDIGYKGTNQETLYKHITRAGATTKADSYRLEKLSSSTHIDAAVALSQAASQAMKLILGNKELDPNAIADRLRDHQISWEEFNNVRTGR